MENLRKNPLKTPPLTKSQVADAANELLHESKKLASEIYEEGLNKLNTAEQHVKEYSHHVLRRVQENPVAAICIAGGIGFILSRLLKK